MALKFALAGTLDSGNNFNIPTVSTTVCFWLTIASIETLHRFWDCNDMYECRSYTTPIKLRMDIYDIAGGVCTDNLTVGVRNHYLLTGTRAGITTLYFNGVSNVTNTSTHDISPTTDNLRLGGNGTNSAYGTIEDFRVYNREVSLNEIKAIYYSGGRDGIINGLQNRYLVTNIGNGADIGTDVIYDLYKNNNLTKTFDNVNYTPGFLNPRRRV